MKELGWVLPSNRLMGMCCLMGSHFNDWTDYNGLAFAMELHRVRRMGFAQNFGGKKIQASGE